MSTVETTPVSPLDSLIRQKATEGWRYVTIESLVRENFLEGRHVVSPHQTASEIMEKYQRDGNEVLLVPIVHDRIFHVHGVLDSEEFAQLLLSDVGKSYCVFVRSKRNP